jgi:hypothetical protein
LFARIWADVYAALAGPDSDCARDTAGPPAAPDWPRAGGHARAIAAIRAQGQPEEAEERGLFMRFT